MLPSLHYFPQSLVVFIQTILQVDKAAELPLLLSLHYFPQSLIVLLRTILQEDKGSGVFVFRFLCSGSQPGRYSAEDQSLVIVHSPRGVVGPLVNL